VDADLAAEVEGALRDLLEPTAAQQAGAVAQVLALVPEQSVEIDLFDPDALLDVLEDLRRDEVAQAVARAVVLGGPSAQLRERLSELRGEALLGGAFLLGRAVHERAQHDPERHRT